MNNINRKGFRINHFNLEDIRGSYRCVDLTKRSKPYEKGPLLMSCSFCDHCVNIYQQVFAGAVSELYNNYYNKVLLESRSLYAVSIYEYSAVDAVLQQNKTCRSQRLSIILSLVSSSGVQGASPSLPDQIGMVGRISHFVPKSQSGRMPSTWQNVTGIHHAGPFHHNTVKNS